MPDIKKMPNQRLLICLAVLLFVTYVVYNYSSQLGLSTSRMTNQRNNNQEDVYPGESSPSLPNLPQVNAAMPRGMNSGPADSAHVGTITGGVSQSCLKQQVANPSDLLPRDSNQDFGS